MANQNTVHPKKNAHCSCFAVLCCGYTLTDFPISIRLTSLALWQSNDCPSAGKATLMNMDKYFMWIHYERIHNHNIAKHNKTVCIFLGIYCTCHVSLFTAWYNSRDLKFAVDIVIDIIGIITLLWSIFRNKRMANIRPLFHIAPYSRKKMYLLSTLNMQIYIIWIKRCLDDIGYRQSIELIHWMSYFLR